MKRMIAAGLLCLAAMALGPDAARACSCLATDEGPIELLASGAVVARGRIALVSPAKPASFPDALVYEFAVDQALNGRLPAVIRVSTPRSSAACGAGLAEGEVVLHLGEARAGGAVEEPYRVTICGQLPIDRRIEEWNTLFDAIEAAR